MPNSTGTAVRVISSRTRKIVEVSKAGQLSQHISRGYDLRGLYVTSSVANQLIAIDRAGRKFPHVQHRPPRQPLLRALDNTEWCWWS